MRPRPRPRPITVRPRPRPRPKKMVSRPRWSRDHAGLETLTSLGNMAVSRMRNENMQHITLIYGRIGEIFASYRKSWSRDTTVTSDLRAEVEIWPFRACMHETANAFGHNQFVHCGLGYGADTTFHRAYF